MKKIIALILLLLLCLPCVSCDDDIDSSSVEESSKESESSSKESESEESSSESSNKDSQSQSSSESSSASSSEESSKEVVLVTEYGGFSTLAETTPSADRVKQIKLSNLHYNSGSSYSESQISSILSSAKKIQAGGFLYQNAGSLMKHFLENTGERYIIDVSSFVKDETAHSNRNVDLNKALRACEKLAVEGKSVNAEQIEESLFHNLSGDWKYAVGSYFTSTSIKNLTVSGNNYNATFTYKVIDFYNWDESDDNAVFSSGIAAMLIGDISPKDLHQLHREGKAKEFLSYGEITYSITWAKGTDISTAVISVIPNND